jgi:hypothetical protein
LNNDSPPTTATTIGDTAKIRTFQFVSELFVKMASSNGVGAKRTRSSA